MFTDVPLSRRVSIFARSPLSLSSRESAARYALAFGVIPRFLPAEGIRARAVSRPSLWRSSILGPMVSQAPEVRAGYAFSRGAFLLARLPCFQRPSRIPPLFSSQSGRRLAVSVEGLQAGRFPSTTGGFSRISFGGPRWIPRFGGSTSTPARLRSRRRILLAAKAITPIIFPLLRN